jgi:hypothetical protein
MSPLLNRCTRPARVPDAILMLFCGIALGALCAAFV